MPSFCLFFSVWGLSQCYWHLNASRSSTDANPQNIQKNRKKKKKRMVWLTVSTRIKAFRLQHRDLTVLSERNKISITNISQNTFLFAREGESCVSLRQHHVKIYSSTQANMLIDWCKKNVIVFAGWEALFSLNKHVYSKQWLGCWKRGCSENGQTSCFLMVVQMLEKPFHFLLSPKMQMWWEYVRMSIKHIQ